MKKARADEDEDFDGSEPLVAPEPALLAAAGGREGLTALAAAFYARVARNPVLRPVFPRTMQRAGAGRAHLASRLARYLTELLGGPASYSDRYGHPTMYVRHLPFRIGPAEAAAWVDEMAAALDDVQVDPPARAALLRLFDEAARELVNADADGAALPPVAEWRRAAAIRTGSRRARHR